MELWIRSQDKQRLVKANGLSISNIGEVYLDNEKMILLGEYTPYERALDVLDEIQDKLKVLVTDEAGAEFILARNLVPIIYEMPKD